VKNLTVISNNAGAEGFGLWMLLDSRQVRKMIALSAKTSFSSNSIYRDSWSLS